VGGSGADHIALQTQHLNDWSDARHFSLCRWHGRIGPWRRFVREEYMLVLLC
jgi:hypothetical protein